MFLVLFSLIPVSLAATAQVVIQPDITSTQTGVKGTVQLKQDTASEQISISIDISGLTPGSTHGMHIHGSAVTGQNCTMAGGHWNPLNATHGAPTNTRDKRHFGDLGNFKADVNGAVKTTISDTLLSFFGDYPIKDNSLAFVVHEKHDDLGLNATSPDSLKTGNCGSRLSCGNIVFITAASAPGANGTTSLTGSGGSSTSGTGGTAGGSTTQQPKQRCRTKYRKK